MVSVDGIGAYNMISRQAMLSGLLDMKDGGELVPFVSALYGSPSTYLWGDELGAVHEIQQGEGGEQGGRPDANAFQSWAASGAGGDCRATLAE